MTRARDRAWVAAVVSTLLAASAMAGEAADGGAVAAEAGSMRPVRESYVLHCSGCHRVDGHGIEGVAPDLHAIGPLVRTAEGRAYLVRVPGVAQSPTNDEELAVLLNWVLEEFAGVPPERPYTAAEVSTLRARPLRDPRAARRALSTPDS